MKCKMKMNQGAENKYSVISEFRICEALFRIPNLRSSASHPSDLKKSPAVSDEAKAFSFSALRKPDKKQNSKCKMQNKSRGRK